MATRNPRPAVPASARRGRDRREARLAELVAELSSCDADDALEAVRSAPEAEDPLQLVARAVTGVRHRSLEPQDRLRVAGFLRARDQRLPRRAGSGTALAERRGETDDHLVHHGSLRRWERSHPDDLDAPAPAQVTGDIIDLRDRTARFRRPGSAGQD